MDFGEYDQFFGFAKGDNYSISRSTRMGRD